MGRHPRTEYESDQDELNLSTDWTVNLGGLSNVAGRPNQFWVGVADVVAREASLAELTDYGVPGQAVVDLAGQVRRRSTQGCRAKAHSQRLPARAGPVTGAPQRGGRGAILRFRYIEPIHRKDRLS